MAVISSLFVYPIKSCAGISLQRMEFDALGPKHDRRWMVVDENGRFLTQRENPKLALIQPRLEGDRLKVTRSGADELVVPSEATSETTVSVWRFRGIADDLGDTTAAWFAEALGRPCRLVRFHPGVVRATSQQHTQTQSQVAFADGYPVLLASLESLGELNRRLLEPVTMNRFRPNLVVRNVQPFAEDHWSTLHAPALSLEVVKPCKRCVITTVNQANAEVGREPLKTLATFRKQEGEVVFGQNCVHLSNGVLQVGDPLVPV